MTDQEINIAVAEACGEPVCTHHPAAWVRRGPEGDSELYCTECRKYLHDMRVAKYCSDLNAMNKAEKTLPEGNGIHGRTVYDNTLMRICGTHQACISAEARQRAEAFLRAIGKWRDT